MYDIIKYDNYVYIKPESNIDSVTASNFKDTILSIIHEIKYKTIIIDFSKITYIDSIGCGVIIYLFNKLHLNDVLLEITNASKDIFNLFSTVRLNRLIKINTY